MLCTAVSNYITSVKGHPFFYVVGDVEYKTVLEELKQSGLHPVRVSDFCAKDDKFPNIDDLVDNFRTSDVDYHSNKSVVVGLGECLALRGSAETEKVLNRLKNTTLGNARVVLLLRCVSSQAIEIIQSDKRMEAQQRAYISSDTVSQVSIVNSKYDNGASVGKGIKALLRLLEDGAVGSVCGNTMLSLDNSMLKVSCINSAFDALCNSVEWNIPSNAGTEEQWDWLLKQLTDKNGRIENVFNAFEFDEECEQEINDYVSGYENKNWLYFIYLKTHINQINNSYLKTVVQHTEKFDELKRNILIGIVSITHTDKMFDKYYQDRKKLVKYFAESDIAMFISENQIEIAESIYRYTDNTLAERQAIIKWIAQYGYNPVIDEIYPALGAYLKRYEFNCGSISAELTDYFDKYKHQKVTNRITEDFMELVNTHAKDLLYTKLPTRNQAINSITEKNTACLYWIDALGVEYLSYIVYLAKKKGLSINIDIARADLPTITKENKAFFESWTGMKYKEERLDDIKHHEKGGFIFSDTNPEPIHLPSELEIIKEAIDTAATRLAMHECKSFVIASDHGASRLAVIRKQEEKYETDTQGEHSGRCCKEFDDCDLDYVIRENGYLVLSDYGRFKGSRAANVEVHGGASLEEIVVPVITLKLKGQNEVSIKVINENDIRADRHEGTTITLYISYVEYPHNLTMRMKGVSYSGMRMDSTHYDFKLNDIKRSKECKAEIYDGDNLIGTVEFSVKGRISAVSTGFGDDLF